MLFDASRDKFTFPINWGLATEKNEPWDLCGMCYGMLSADRIDPVSILDLQSMFSCFLSAVELIFSMVSVLANNLYRRCYVRMSPSRNQVIL